MKQSQFIPARSSRHRIAVIALFRALVRQGRSIKLPQDVCRRGKSPISQLVKRGFERNRADWSPRLVFAALSAGYKFLAFFKNAQTEGSKEHTEILAYLHEKNEMIARSEKNRRPPKKPREKKQDLKPVLQRISAPDEPPKFITPMFPRPRDSFEGRRRIPHVIATASQHAFLRYKKGPQPRVVSHILRRKQAYKVHIGETLNEFPDTLQEAESEDKWDQIVEEALRAENAGKTEVEEPADDNGPPVMGYADSEYESRRYIYTTVNNRRDVDVAKLEAMIEAVKGEEKLLAEEVEEAKKYGVRIIPTELERIKPYMAYRKVRKSKKRLGTKRRKVQRWQRKLVGLAPDPITT